MGWHIAAKVEELSESEPLGVMVAGEPIALYRLGGQIFATHNICTHEQALLSDGFIEGDCIECPIHQARFDIRTGAVVSPPATEPVKTYPVKIEDGRILVELA
jgi:nitrite reductase/ring-hydroxylating ferredoxin subunit